MKHELKILYVEDEPFLAKIVKESLESRRFQVRLVEDGALVMQAFLEFKPDVCVLDVMLPHKNGFTLAAEIRQLSPSIPLLFLTAKDQTQDLIKGFQSGGNDYIRKPFSMEELIVRIQNLLEITAVRKNQSPVNEKVVLGSYLFYPHRLELVLGAETRKLSHREAELLKLLVAQQNGVTQRKDILLELWGDDSFFNSRNLDVYITRLRDLFKKDPRIEIITLKGVGYHFLVKEG